MLNISYVKTAEMLTLKNEYEILFCVIFIPKKK